LAAAYGDFGAFEVGADFFYGAEIYQHLAMMLRNLALAYVQTGKAAAAERSAKAAYAIVESRFGSADPSLTPILNVLAYGTALHNLGALREFSGDLMGAALRRVLGQPQLAIGSIAPLKAP
jgi:hypothetical protein